MNRRSLLALSLGLTVAATACHKNPRPTTAATPSGSTGTTTPPPPPPNNPPPPRDNNPPPDRTDLDLRAADRVKSMAERIHFDYNISDIKSDDISRLDGKAALLKQFPSVRIRITGHADERGSDQYNIALGMRRAAAARDYLIKVGIDGSRIETASLGREVPADPGHDEAAWAQNRRDEFDIIAGSQSLRVP